MLLFLGCLVTSWRNTSLAYAAKGDLGEGYQLDNLDAIYTTVDGEKISSHSDGVITMLVFARTNGMCWNRVNTVQAICDSNWIKDDRIRVFVVGIDQASVKTVQAMQDAKERDTAYFCYDESYSAANTMWNYVDHTLGSNGSVTLPITVIVDGNAILDLNDVQQTLKIALGLVSADEKQISIADVNRDGKVTLADARKILRVVLQVDPSL